MKIYYYGIAFLILLFLLNVACKKIVSDEGDIQLEVPINFTYQTEKNITVRFEAILPTGEKISNIQCILSTTELDENNVPVEIIAQGFTDENGVFETTVKIPATITELYMKIQFWGLTNSGIFNTIDGSATLRLGEGISTSSIATNKRKLQKTAIDTSNYTPTVTLMGAFDDRGTPQYLAPDRVVSGTVLAALNNALPEEVSVLIYHPEYLASGNETNAVTTDSVDLSVTFLHEGTGYPNSFGYYISPGGFLPPSMEDSLDVNIIFPHVEYQMFSSSADYYWETIRPGNTVNLGTIPPNTSVGWALFFDSFKYADSSVNSGLYQLYSDPELNEVADANLQQHMVLLSDLSDNKIYVGFEQLRRDTLLGKVNDDFNDIVVYFDADSIDITNITPIKPPPDCDGDGVPDYWDDYPCDPTLAYDVTSGYKTIAFEDTWPKLGDNDFNDLVVSYNTKQVRNSSNETTKLEINLITRAAGSTNNNGFGFELNTTSGNVLSATGNRLTTGLISSLANGLEAGQTNATIIAFDNVLSTLSPPSGANRVNTQEGYQFVTPDTLFIEIVFDTPVLSLSLNPFMFINGERGREVHQNNYKPTDLADFSYFNTEDDSSNTSLGIYYRTANNLPWALEMPIYWDYPFEGRSIYETYLHYSTWQTSGGVSYSDWYYNTTGYTNVENIYRSYGIGKLK